MEITIFADVRGRNLSEALDDAPQGNYNMNFTVWVFPDAGIRELGLEALGHVKNNPGHIAVVLGGISDLCSWYEDVGKVPSNIYLRQEEGGVGLSTTISDEILAVQLQIEEEMPEAPVIFAPLLGAVLSPPVQDDGQDGHLDYQQVLHNVIIMTNQRIVTLNTVRGVPTPWVARPVHTRVHGQWKHKYRYLHHGMVPSPLLLTI